MARTKKANKVAYRTYYMRAFLFSSIGLLVLIAVGVSQNVWAVGDGADVILADHDPNFHVETVATQFFEDNDAAEMIPVIRCESHFRHYESDGTPLKNKEGSSAIGVAQILASKHPDPRIIERYNRKLDMDMKIEDFDITTLEGNLGYALVLYKVRGTRDWECGHKFGW